MMKKILLFGAIAVAAIACKPEEQVTPEVKVLSDAAALVIAQEGGEALIDFDANVEWTAELKEASAADWCSIAPKSGAAGANKVKVIAIENETNDNRTVTVVLKAQTAQQEVVVTQLQKNALVAGQTSYDVPSEGGQIEVVLGHNVDYSVAIDAAWLTEVKTKAYEETKLVFAAEANTALEGRTAKITITAGDLKQEITVNQAAFVPTFEMDATELWIASEGGSAVLNITANFEYSVAVAEGCDWLTVTSEGGKHTFTAVANPDFAYRAVEIVINGWTKEDDENTTDVNEAQKFYVFQNGRASTTWTKKPADLGLTLAAGTTRMALKDGMLFLANGGSSVLVVDAATGTYVTAVNLPDGFVATSLTNDDAGNLVIAAELPYGATTNVYYLSSMNLEDVKVLCTLNNDVVREVAIDAWGAPTTTGTASNLRVSGDVTGDAVITMGLGLIEHYIACEIKGGVAQPQVSGKLPEYDKLVNSPNDMVVYPLGTTIADGVVYTGYTLTYSVYYSTDMQEWTSIIAGEDYANGNDSPNAMASAKVNGKDYLAIGIGCHFSWTQARVVVYDITDKTAVKKVGTWNLADSGANYVGTTGPNCDVAIVPGEGDSFTLYYFGGASEVVARVDVK